MRLVFREGFGLELGLVYVVEGFALGGWEVFAEGVCVLHVLGEVAVVLDESWGERGYEGIDDGGLILCITHDVAFVQVTHGNTATLNVSYTQHLGSLQVVLQPAAQF